MTPILLKTMGDEWVALSKVHVWPGILFQSARAPIPPLDSCGLAEAEATGELREGKFPLNWRPATVLGCNDFTNIFKQRTHI